ncbi:hypothetical protein LIER_20646 [Lithospermum erythrorhizon]|uniref:DELLA protein n=1 Tax=Lithospermum erythrorhizon TaxID=34254 RepID=A0AAV3QSW9_LITER
MLLAMMRLQAKCIAEQDRELQVEEWGAIHTFCNEYGSFQDTAAHKLTKGPGSQSVSLELHQPPPLSASNALQFFVQKYSHYVNNIGASTDGDKEKERLALSPASSDREERTAEGNPKLSTDQIIILVGERFIGFSSHKFININAHTYPYSSNLEGITLHDKMDVELVQLLLTVTEKISHKQTDRACKLLFNCKKLASNLGTPVQRAVFYFAEALAKKIERETGQIVSNIPQHSKISSKLKHHRAVLAWYHKLPFPQALQFAGVQAILEKVMMNSKVHMIDIQMRIGATWAIVMQALSEQQGFKVKQLKLTVIETIEKEAVQEACTQLQNFAKTLNLIFSDHIILLSDMKDLRHHQFEVEPDEVVVAHAPVVLRSMIARPRCLERLMSTLKRLNPSVMVITEVEANHNSPSFVNRFVEHFHTVLLSLTASKISWSAMIRIEWI